MADDVVTQFPSGEEKCSLKMTECKSRASELVKRKLSHKQLKASRKKEKRKFNRQQAAQERDGHIKNAELQSKSPYYQILLQREEEQEHYEEQYRERQRQLQHTLWVERERLALQQIAESKRREEIFNKNRAEEEQRIRDEWQEQQRKESEEQKKREEQEKAKKDKKDALMKEARSGEKGKDDGSWHNPLAPANYGQEVEMCPFFAKTGSCRYGERCSRAHPFTDSSCTLLFKGMYVHFALMEGLQDEFDLDITLEYEDRETYQHFRDFYEDVLPEFREFGTVVQFKVCCNYEPHLRGNVYVQYKRMEDAQIAFARFNARWYAGRQLQCEFCSVTKWKNAICGQFKTKKCPKGKNCNFLHVFRNPSGEFWEADRDYDTSEPRSDRHHNWSQRSSRTNRPWVPNWDRQRSCRRSRSRSRERRKRQRSRSPSRRSTQRSRSRSMSPRQGRSVRSQRSTRKSRSRSPYRVSSSRSKARESSYRRSRSKSPTESLVSRTDNKWDSDLESDDESRDNRAKISTSQRRKTEKSSPRANGLRHSSQSPSGPECELRTQNQSRSHSPEDKRHKYKKHKEDKKHKHRHDKKNVNNKESLKKCSPEVNSTEQTSGRSMDNGKGDRLDQGKEDNFDMIQKDCIKQIKDCIKKAKKDALYQGRKDITDKGIRDKVEDRIPPQNGVPLPIACALTPGIPSECGVSSLSVVSPKDAVSLNKKFATGHPS